MKPLKTLKAQRLTKPAVRAACDGQAEEFTVARDLWPGI